MATTAAIITRADNRGDQQLRDGVGARHFARRVLESEDIYILPYIVAANLVASCSRPGEGEWWYRYLGKIEDAIERMPDQRRGR